jgi:hypothetical protein
MDSWLDDVPIEIRHDLLRMLFQPYYVAASQATDYAKPTARKLFPSLIVANVEEGLRSLAARHANSIRLEEKFNASKTYRYPELTINDSVVLTASTVHHPREFPRHADFREALAEINYSLFDDEPHIGRRLYVVLTHGDDGEARNRPAFAGLGAPDRFYKEYAEYFSLFDNYKAIVAEILGIKPEDVPSEAEVRRRTFRKRMEDGDE